MKHTLAASAFLIVCCGAYAAPVTYNVDPGHTYPSFEADHMGGMSILRGKFTKNSGTVVLDRDAKTGSVDITVDATSIDFGDPKLNEHVKSDLMLDVQKFPTAEYKGKLAKFKDGAPTEVEGDLTLHGVSKPVTLQINQFTCRVNPMLKREVCGADASATINRKDFGVDFGEKTGFKMDMKLQIEIEAIKAP